MGGRSRRSRRASGRAAARRGAVHDERHGGAAAHRGAGGANRREPGGRARGPARGRGLRALRAPRVAGGVENGAARAGVVRHDRGRAGRSPGAFHLAGRGRGLHGSEDVHGAPRGGRSGGPGGGGSRNVHHPRPSRGARGRRGRARHEDGRGGAGELAEGRRGDREAGGEYVPKEARDPDREGGPRGDRLPTGEDPARSTTAAEERRARKKRGGAQ